MSLANIATAFNALISKIENNFQEIASSISNLTTNKQNASTAVTHTQGSAVGSSTRPVMISSSGVATAINYTIQKSVPSNAVFTDTTYSTGDANTAGITKLYTDTGSNTDGTMTQAAITEALNNAGGSSESAAVDGLIENVEVLSDGTITLDSDYTIYSIQPSEAITFVFDTSDLTVSRNQYITFDLRINMVNYYALTFPNTITWDEDTVPTISSIGLYYLRFRSENGGSTWKGKLIWSSATPITPTYKASLICGTTYTNLEDLGITDNINPDTTFGKKSKQFVSDYLIINSKLYLYRNSTLTQVGDLTGWTSVTGYATASNYKAYGICNGGLYYLLNDTATRIGSYSDWTEVQGYYTSNVRNYGFGVRNGSLYYISGGSASAIGSLTGWSDIACNSSTSGFGICNGSLYRIIFDSWDTPTVTQIDSRTNWVSVSGYTQERNGYGGYGINSNGELFYLYMDTVAQVGTSNTWTKVCGNSRTSSYGNTKALGLNNGKIYSLWETTATQIGSDNTWKDIYSTGYANNNGTLYKIETATETYTETTFTEVYKLMGGGSATYPAIVIYEDI